MPPSEGNNTKKIEHSRTTNSKAILTHHSILRKSTHSLSTPYMARTKSITYMVREGTRTEYKPKWCRERSCATTVLTCHTRGVGRELLQSHMKEGILPSRCLIP